jgi:hypothetical protein
MFTMVEIIWTLFSDAIMELSAQLTSYQKVLRSEGPRVR